MKLRNGYSSFLAAALAGAALTAASPAQQTAAAPPPAPATQSATPGNKGPIAPLLNEEVLRKRFVGKMVFVRGFYAADELSFDVDGRIVGSPATTSFTLDALEVRKVDLSKKKLQIEADRYALHFTGALPSQDDSKAFDKVKISKKPVRITIDRELVVVLKTKKQKVKDKPKANAGVKPAPQSATASDTLSTASAAPVPPPSPALPPGSTTSPAHSAMMLSAALDKVLATDIDDGMLAHLPGYWQQYFKSERSHQAFVPSDPHVLQVGGNVTAPKVLNSIDPSSNQYAQKFGVAGLAMFRTVVDAQGKPTEIAIARPIGFGLDEKAIDAIKASHFQPATQDGKPVPVVIDMVVTFRIYSNRTKPGSVVKGSKQTEVVASAWESDSSKPSH